MRSSERAWLALCIGVAAYEYLASDGELLSQQMDRWLASHPVITWVATVITAAHLLNVLDKHPALAAIDPFPKVPFLGAKLKGLALVRS
jgi:hypothetical protein